MKIDPHLRAVIKAMRKANSTGSLADFKRARALSLTYKSPCRALDVDAAIDELGTWGTTENPCDISPELRGSLILFLKGEIGLKRGRKRGAASDPGGVSRGIRVLIATQAARAYQDPRMKDKRMTRRQAIARAADEMNVGFHSIDAKLSPRKRTRKT